MAALEKFLDKFLSPIATFMSNSLFFRTLSEAFMRTTPVTLGAAILMIIGNFPVPGWTNYLTSIGLYVHFIALQGATLNIIGVFVAFNFAFIYAKSSKQEPVAAGLLAIASFFILMPQSILVPQLAKFVEEGAATVESVKTVQAFDTFFTGGTGLLVAILTGYIVARLYVFLNEKHIVIKLPDSVPTNVAESLSPSILAGIIFILFFITRIGFSFTPFGNIFHFIAGLVQAPLQSLVGSPINIVIIFTIANIFWFFGIHPNMVYGIIMPFATANGLANSNAYLSGQRENLPFLTFAIAVTLVGAGFGGQGGTHGLLLSMSKSKSERYKQLFKLSVFPGIFNINEPLIFGMPIMMNPLFFFPMILSPMIMASVGFILYKVVNMTLLNPMITLPWTTPALVGMLFQGGWKYLVIGLGASLANFFLWYPFFKMADNQEYANEQQLFKENLAE